MQLLKSNFHIWLESVIVQYARLCILLKLLKGTLQVGRGVYICTYNKTSGHKFEVTVATLFAPCGLFTWCQLVRESGTNSVCLCTWSALGRTLWYSKAMCQRRVRGGWIGYEEHTSVSFIVWHVLSLKWSLILVLYVYRCDLTACHLFAAVPRG